MYKDGLGVCLVSGVRLFVSVEDEGERGPGGTKSCLTFLRSGATP